MTRRQTWTLGLVGGLGVLAYLSTSQPAPAPRPTRPDPAPLVLSAAALRQAFSDNEISAERTYGGDTTLEVHGNVETIAKTNQQVPYVKFVSSELFGVQALFDNVSQTQGLENLRPGEYVHIVCRYDSVQRNVILRDCRIKG